MEHSDDTEWTRLEASLTTDLRRLGIADAAVLMVHVSLRAVGATRERAPALLRALDAAVGRGTLLMVLGARNDWAWVNERAESERAGLLCGAPPFDPLNTPAESEVGGFAEAFRSFPGTVVNDHPEGRFAARGARALELLAEAPWDDYYGPGSPLDRLVAAHGQVLRLGADLNTVTLLHYAEYLANLPHKRRIRRHRVVAGPAGPSVRVIDSLDDSEGVVDVPGEDYFARITRAYLATGRARAGRVGGATAELIDARDLVRFATTWLETHLAAASLGCK